MAKEQFSNLTNFLLEQLGQEKNQELYKEKQPKKYNYENKEVDVPEKK